jgi:tetratricopeptide (TPR) repeat protein
VRSVLGALVLGCLAAGAAAQSVGHRPVGDVRQIEIPETSEAVLRAVATPYLSEEERAEKRVFHGLWTEADLASPRLRARAALVAGVLDDRSFADPAALPEDRAEAALARGEPERTLGILEGRAGSRASRLRAEAFEILGRTEEAKAAVEPVVVARLRTKATDPEELVEGVRAMGVKARLEGRPGRDYKSMLQLLLSAQQDLDRLYWPAVLAQAELLYEKDNSKEANDAAVQVLTLNPACARAWRIIAQIAVDGFAFDRTEMVAHALDNLVRRLDPDSGRTSPDGDLMLARAAMRQNDPLLAQENVRRTLNRYPTMREALALEAATEALLFEFEAADAMLASLDALSPGSPLAAYEVGKALAESRQYAKAAEYLEAAAARQPNWAQPHIELGLLEMQAGRDMKALTALRRATELDVFNTRAQNSLKIVEDLTKYESIESPHFIVRHPGGVVRVMAEEMLAPLEEIHRIVAGAIQHEPAQRTTIEVLPDHQTFAVRITGMTGIHTIAAATGPVIAMEVPREGKQHEGEYDWVRVVRHEYTHTVTLSRTQNRIPHWFTEAAAVHLENCPRDYETCKLLLAALTGGGGLHLFDMREINLNFVRPSRPSDRAQAYAQGHWMYQFIVDRWGASAPLRLMDLYSVGIAENQAMREVLGRSQESFLAEFRAWAERDAASWGMLPERSMTELLVEQTLADPEAGPRAVEDLAAFALGTAFTLSGVEGGRRYRVTLLEPEGEVLERLVTRHPDHPDVLEVKVQADLAGRDGNADASMIPLLERCAAARPVDPMPHRHLARLYLAGEAPDEAVPHLEYLDAREQKSAAYAVELARRYTARGDMPRAQAKIERATQIAPFDPKHRETAASIALKSGDLASAERHLAALTEIEPQHDLHRERLRRVREMRAKN